MTINLPIIFDQNGRLELLKIELQDIKISKFSGGPCSQIDLLKSQFSDVLRLDSLVNRKDLPS